MKLFRAMLLTCAGMMVFAGLSFGQDESSDEDSSNVRLKPSGFASYEVGQIVKANPRTTNDAAQFQTDHLLYQRAFVGFNLQAAYDPLPITTNIGVELKSFTETPRKKKVSDDFGIAVRLFYFLYLSRADFNYSPMKEFNLDVGYFPVKYNQESRNLGEYLFRSGTYPQYLITNFDFAAARVMGINAFGTFFDALDYKALLTINTDGATMGDLNFTGIASYSLLNKFFDVGAGVSFCSFISANTAHTQPPKALVDNPNDWYITKNGDTATYTFAGTKLMGRFTIDPKVLFPSDAFGVQDLKLYAEVAVLGVQDYPVSVGTNLAVDTSTLSTRYNNIVRRIPITLGFNFPTFKFLDVLSIEAEYFDNPYPNDMTTNVLYGIPLPLTSKWNSGSGTSNYADTTNDNLKWSVYAKKTMAGHFFITGQVASDHYRWEKNGYGDQANLLVESFTKPDQFYYVVKLGYSF